MKIITNNKPREVIHAHELSPDERDDFDYLDWSAIDEGSDSASFFRYRGELYDIGEFSRIIPPGARRVHPMECQDPNLQGWDGYLTDSYFSGMVIRWARDSGRIDADYVIVGRFVS